MPRVARNREKSDSSNNQGEETGGLFNSRFDEAWRNLGTNVSQLLQAKRGDGAGSANLGCSCSKCLRRAGPVKESTDERILHITHVLADVYEETPNPEEHIKPHHRQRAQEFMDVVEANDVDKLESYFQECREEHRGEIVCELIISAAQAGHVDTIKCLSKFASDTEYLDMSDSAKGARPLMFAAHNGHVAAVRLLLELGADPNAVDDHGYNALTIATFCDRAGVAEVLCEDKETIVDQTDERERTALCYAALYGSDNCVHVLAAHGADVFHQDDEQADPLALADQSGRASTAEALRKLQLKARMAMRRAERKAEATERAANSWLGEEERARRAAEAEAKAAELLAEFQREEDAKKVAAARKAEAKRQQQAAARAKQTAPRKADGTSRSGSMSGSDGGAVAGNDVEATSKSLEHRTSTCSERVLETALSADILVSHPVVIDKASGREKSLRGPEDACGETIESSYSHVNGHAPCDASNNLKTDVTNADQSEQAGASSLLPQSPLSRLPPTNATEPVLRRAWEALLNDAKGCKEVELQPQYEEAIRKLLPRAVDASISVKFGRKLLQRLEVVAPARQALNDALAASERKTSDIEAALKLARPAASLLEDSLLSEAEAALAACRAADEVYYQQQQASSYAKSPPLQSPHHSTSHNHSAWHQNQHGQYSKPSSPTYGHHQHHHTGPLSPKSQHAQYAQQCPFVPPPPPPGPPPSKSQPASQQPTSPGHVGLASAVDVAGAAAVIIPAVPPPPPPLSLKPMSPKTPAPPPPPHSVPTQQQNKAVSGQTAADIVAGGATKPSAASRQGSTSQVPVVSNKPPVPMSPKHQQQVATPPPPPPPPPPPQSASAQQQPGPTGTKSAPQHDQESPSATSTVTDQAVQSGQKPGDDQVIQAQPSAAAVEETQEHDKSKELANAPQAGAQASQQECADVTGPQPGAPPPHAQQQQALHQPGAHPHLQQPHQFPGHLQHHFMGPHHPPPTGHFFHPLHPGMSGHPLGHMQLNPGQHPYQPFGPHLGMHQPPHQPFPHLRPPFEHGPAHHQQPAHHFPYLGQQHVQQPSAPGTAVGMQNEAAEKQAQADAQMLAAGGYPHAGPHPAGAALGGPTSRPFIPSLALPPHPLEHGHLQHALPSNALPSPTAPLSVAAAALGLGGLSLQTCCNSPIEPGVPAAAHLLGALHNTTAGVGSHVTTAMTPIATSTGSSISESFNMGNVAVPPALSALWKTPMPGAAATGDAIASASAMLSSVNPTLMTSISSTGSLGNMPTSPMVAALLGGVPPFIPASMRDKQHDAAQNKIPSTEQQTLQSATTQQQSKVLVAAADKSAENSAVNAAGGGSVLQKPQPQVTGEVATMNKVPSQTHLQMQGKGKGGTSVSPVSVASPPVQAASAAAQHALTGTAVTQSGPSKASDAGTPLTQRNSSGGGAGKNTGPQTAAAAAAAHAHAQLRQQAHHVRPQAGVLPAQPQFPPPMHMPGAFGVPGVNPNFHLPNQFGVQHHGHGYQHMASMSMNPFGGGPGHMGMGFGPGGAVGHNMLPSVLPGVKPPGMAGHTGLAGGMGFGGQQFPQPPHMMPGAAHTLHPGATAFVPSHARQQAAPGQGLGARMSSTSSLDTSCVLCHTREKNAICGPCMHACMCTACANKVLQARGSCPVCKSSIENVLDVLS